MLHYLPMEQLVISFVVLLIKMTRSNWITKSRKQLVQIDKVVSFTPITFGYFLLKNPIRKTMNCSSEYKKQKKVKLVTLQKLQLIRGYIHQRQIKQISPRYIGVLPQCFITQSFQTLLSQEIEHNFVKENNVPTIQRRFKHRQAPCAFQLCKLGLKDYLQRRSCKLKKL